MLCSSIEFQIAVVLLLLGLHPRSAHAAVELPRAVLPEDVDAALHQQPKWKKSQFPLSQRPNGCGPDGLDRIIPDRWHDANFTEACNRHDICYSTLGSDPSMCNEQFGADLATACWESYPAEESMLQGCLKIGHIYLAAVQAGAETGVFLGSQRRQLQYENAVRAALPAIIEHSTTAFAGFAPSPM